MPTFGKTTAGASSSASSVDKKTASKHAPASSGTVNSITFRASLSATGTSNVRGFIYADNAGAPGALLAVSDAGTITNTTVADKTLPFSGVNAINVTNGTPYWIGWHWSDPGTPSVNVWRDATASSRVEGTDTFSDGSSNPFGTPTTLTGVTDCFVTYTEASSNNSKFLGFF